MSLKISSLSVTRNYQSADRPWSITASFSANKGISGYMPLPPEAVDEIMSTAIRCVNASLPQFAEDVAKAIIPELPAPPAPILDADFEEVPPYEGAPF